MKEPQNPLRDGYSFLLTFLMVYEPGRLYLLCVEFCEEPAKSSGPQATIAETGREKETGRHLGGDLHVRVHVGARGC